MENNDIDTRMEDFARELKITITGRIQRLEQELKDIIMPYIPSQMDKHASDSPDGRMPLPTMTSPKLFNDKMFSIIERHSKQVGALSYIRSVITPDNALEVSRILDAGDYKEWSKQQLRSFFGH